ncbi:MAG: hypothetical protein Q9220_006388 [cf. Caloplaca sp. 1 TL-2023]
MVADNPSSTIIFPKDPPGFGILIDLDTNHCFETEKVYLAAITMIHDWADKGWDYTFKSGPTRYVKEIYGISLSFRSLALPAQRYQLQEKHMIIGMLHLIDQMTKVKKFCVSTASVLTYRQPVGFLRLAVPGTPIARNSSDVGQAITEDVPSRIKNRDLQTSGRAVDPQDPDFAVAYQRIGDPLSCVEILSASLYAMATAAQGDGDNYCSMLGGFNEQRTVVWRILGRRPTVSGYLLSYDSVRTGLMILSAQLYRTGFSGEVGFQFEYKGDNLGGGSITLSDFTTSTAR